MCINYIIAKRLIIDNVNTLALYICILLPWKQKESLFIDNNIFLFYIKYSMFGYCAENFPCY